MGRILCETQGVSAHISLFCAAMEVSVSAALNPYEHSLQTSAKEYMEVDSTSNATATAWSVIYPSPIPSHSYESDNLFYDTDPHPMVLNYEGGAVLVLFAWDDVELVKHVNLSVAPKALSHFNADVNMATLASHSNTHKLTAC